MTYELADDFKIFHNKNELAGTAYMELLPGKFHNEYWNDNSIYIDEEGFCFLENIIESVVPKFERYSETTISKGKWGKIIHAFNEFKQKLITASQASEVMDFIYEGLYKELNNKFHEYKIVLVKMLEELCQWVEEQLTTNKYLSVLGL